MWRSSMRRASWCIRCSSAGRRGRGCCVEKLNATGELVYSMFLGGATNSFAQAVAVNASGAAIVSGTTVGTSESPYLTEVNPAGTAIVFSTAQVGGSALAVDAAGNIYMSGR